MQRLRIGLVRNTAAGPLLDLFLVSSIGSVLVTRAYLAATGYPQVGNGTLHIAHVLWGGLLMLIAMILALTTINSGSRRLIACAGGIGFGLFIDEIGKFVTKNVDYFFKPAVAIIYICFISMYFIFRYVGRDNSITAPLALANALSLLAETPIRPLSRSEKQQAELLLTQAASLPLASELTPTVHALPTSADRPSRLRAFARRCVLAPYERFARSRLFLWVIGIEALLGILTIGVLLVDVVLLIPASTREVARQSLEAGAGTSVAAIGAAAASAIYAAIMAIGFVQLRRSRLRALIWFDRAYLFSIVVVQVFLFAESQFAALSGFAITLFIWGAVKIALRDEVARSTPNASAP